VQLAQALHLTRRGRLGRAFFHGRYNGESNAERAPSFVGEDGPRHQRKDDTMPIGAFLDSFPSVLFIAAHLMFLVLGIWGWRATARSKGSLSPLFWLYVVAQAVFLGFFARALTMKMAVLLEQTLMAAMIAMIGLRASRAA
jgi:hypothetical protein